MEGFEVCEIGRESVKSVNASILATLIKELVNKYERNHKSKLQTRRYYIKCNEKLEISPKKYKKFGDDEGFESDGNEDDSLSGDLSNEDAHSTTSSSCVVEDHVFKSSKPEPIRNSYSRDPASLVSIIGSIDSANSSGSSDTDEIDVHSLTPSPVTQSKKLLKNYREYLFDTNDLDSSDKKHLRPVKEEYHISDVIFCHTEPKYPTVIAWVLKKHHFDFGSRLGITGVENFSKSDNCLEIIVTKCKNSDDSRELCSNYQEYSKRIKLDNYKSIKRKKGGEDKKSDAISALTEPKDIKVSLSDMKISNSGLIKASELSILNPKIMTSFRADMKSSLSLNSLLKVEKNTNQGTRTNYEIKSGNMTMESSTKKTQSLVNITKDWTIEPESIQRNGYPKDRSPDFDDHYNLIQRTDTNGVTHLEVTKSRDSKFNVPFSSKSKLRKEIEGVILTDVESYAKKEPVRQRNSSDDVDSKEKLYEAPPIRPERRKYVRKKAHAPAPPVQAQEQKTNTTQVSAPREKPKSSFFLTPHNNENKRINDVNKNKKEHKTTKGTPSGLQPWENQNVPFSITANWRQDSRGRTYTKFDEKANDKKRSLSAGRPAKKVPMAYRYVYINDYRDAPLIKRSIPSKIREVGGNLTNSLHNIRRRNSFDDVITYNNHTKSNLKSVIKKNKKIGDKYCEPKKVTFSAYATVQVVD